MSVGSLRGPLLALGVLCLLAVLAVLAVPVVVQGSESSPASPPDLASLMPIELGTFETQIIVTRGEEHLSGIDPGDGGDPGETQAVELSAELARLLEDTDSSIEDITTAYAFAAVDGFFAFVVAVRIVGVEEGALLPAYLPILRGDLTEPVEEPGKLAGRELLVITSVGNEGESVPLYVYDGGDTIWMLQGPEDVVARVLVSLP
jgi:hypothetical protein